MHDAPHFTHHLFPFLLLRSLKESPSSIEAFAVQTIGPPSILPAHIRSYAPTPAMFTQFQTRTALSTTFAPKPTPYPTPQKV